LSFFRGLAARYIFNLPSRDVDLKAMLHEAIFLATCNATMTNKIPFELQTFFATCNAYNDKQDGGHYNLRKMSSDWPILTKLRSKLQRGCYTQATCLTTLRKVEGRSTFLVTRNATMLHQAMLQEAIFLATCNATMTNKKPFKLQRGCHTCAIFLTTCNADNNKQDGGRRRHLAKDEL